MAATRASAAVIKNVTFAIFSPLFGAIFSSNYVKR
jgi:hypothetical protein